MDQSGELDAEMREMVRGEQKDLVVKQEVLEAAITTMLLPSDPNDDRCAVTITNDIIHERRITILRKGGLFPEASASMSVE